MSDIDTLTKFMDWVENLPPGEYLFRGVTDDDHKIEATTYLRLKNKDGIFINPADNSPEKLLKINEDMIMDAKHQKHKRELQDLELLAELQHTGAATCLIDFTINPFVALWMACRQGSDKSKKGLVYAVNVDDSDKYKRVNYNDLKNELSKFFIRDDIEGYQIHLWQPDYQKPQMLAQQAYFLFGGAQIVESDVYPVRNGDKDTIRNALKISLGIDEGSIFPDFEGFAGQRAHDKLYEGLKNMNPDDIASSCLSQGQQAIKDRRIDNAISSYSTGLSYQPNPSLQNELYRERGNAYYTQDDINAAISDYNKAIEIDPYDAESYFRRGYTKHNNNESLDAITDFDRAIDIDQSKAYYYYWRAMANYALQLYIKSIPDFNKAIQLEPSISRQYYWRGMASFDMNQYVDAIYCFDLGIKKFPSEPLFYYQRGMANSLMGRHREAELDLTNAINRKTDDPYFYFERGKVRKRLNKFDSAKQDLQIALTHAERIENAKLADDIRRELYN